MITSKNTVLKITAGKTNEPMTAEILSNEAISTATWYVNDRDGVKVADGKCEITSHGAALTAAFDAKPWSAEKPYLYTLFVNISYQNGECEELSDRFGFRFLSTDEKYIQRPISPSSGEIIISSSLSITTSGTFLMRDFIIW